jgi:hypothetical protein
MTTVSITRTLRPATRVDRMILRVSAALDRFVLARVERRAARSSVAALTVQDAAAQTRAKAQALGAVGILPR